jgi:hypothetical protein
MNVIISKTPRREKNCSQVKYSDIILDIKKCPRTKHQIKATFINKNGHKVKERFHTFSGGNPKELLTLLQRQLITLGKRYTLFGNGKWKLLGQIRGRALDRSIKDIWSDVVERETIHAARNANAQLKRFVTLINNTKAKMSLRIKY